MSSATVVPTDLRVIGNVHCTGTLKCDTASITDAMCDTNMDLGRGKITQTVLAKYPISLFSFRVHNDIESDLGGTPAADDLGIKGDTFGTNGPYLSAGDLKSAGATTSYARTMFWLPAEYEDGQTVQISMHAGVLTTVADNSCTLDVECHKLDQDSTVSADLCSTSAVSINSLTFADRAFTITEAGLVSGDMFDLRIAIACNDAATSLTVEPIVGSCTVLCDIRG